MARSPARDVLTGFLGQHHTSVAAAVDPHARSGHTVRIGEDEAGRFVPRQSEHGPWHPSSISKHQAGRFVGQQAQRHSALTRGIGERQSWDAVLADRKGQAPTTVLVQDEQPGVSTLGHAPLSAGLALRVHEHELTGLDHVRRDPSRGRQ